MKAGQLLAEIEAFCRRTGLSETRFGELALHDELGDDRSARRTLFWRLFVVGIVVGIAIGSRFVNGLLAKIAEQVRTPA